jgi:hypothetical protein
MAVANPLSLKSILVPSKSIEIEYPGLNGFKINVVFLSRETLVSIRKKSTKTSFKNRQATEEMDDKLFLQLYVNACIKGWTGLKLSYLEQLAPVDLSQHSPDDELPWDQDNALFLMQSSTNFDAFISETVSELANFTKTSTSK